MSNIAVVSRTQRIVVDPASRAISVINEGPQGPGGPTGPSVPDGDKGDITVSGAGTVWTIDGGAISTAKLADLSVTAAKIANDTITATQIAPNAITASELASGAVDIDAILNGAVVNNKIADGAVGSAKIADGAVTNAKSANIAEQRVRGRAVGAGTGSPQDLTGAQLLAIIEVGTPLATQSELDVVAAGRVPTSRTISTTAPLTGGGDLSADRTLAISTATDSAVGVVELATAAEMQTGTDTARVPPVAVLSTASSASVEGAELLTNPAFTGSATGWTLGGGATYGTDNINLVNGATIEQTINVTNGVLYKIAWVDTNAAGTVQVEFGGQVVAEIPSSIVEMSFRAVATGSIVLRFTFTNPTAASVLDSISMVTVSNNGFVAIAGVDLRRPVATSVGVGPFSLRGNTTGTGNVAVGYAALQNATTGSSNVAIGNLAGPQISSGSHNIAIGHSAQAVMNVGVGNVALGSFSLAAAKTSSYQVAIGYNALGVLTTGTFNIAVGSFTLDALTTGSSNTALGYAALGALTTGGQNTAVGLNALVVSTTGSNNTALGYAALGAATTGGNNLAVGFQAGYAPLANTAFATTTAQTQTIIGLQAGLGSAAQDNNIVALGYQATCIGDGAVALGAQAQAAFANSVALGKSTVSTAIDQIKIGARHIELTEVAEPAAPGANQGRIFAQDFSGRTGVGVRFNSGGSKILAIEGTGQPEGVIAAPVGAKYIDTAATNGAVEWIKVSGTGNTGWKVLYGDTGWRTVLAWNSSGVFTTGTAFADANFVPRTGVAGAIKFRRIGDSVRFYMTNFQADADGIAINSLLNLIATPAGFTPDINEQLQRIWGPGVFSILPGTTNIQLSFSAAAGANLIIQNANPSISEWHTDAAWPSSLPGIAG